MSNHGWLNEQEIDVLERARFWIMADADNHNSKAMKKEANELADSINDIIRKYSDK